jgi:SH3-like domain-containing protein
MRLAKSEKIFLLAVIVFGLFFVDEACAERMAIAAKIANIRSGPGMSYEVLWQVAMYHPIEVNETSGAWYGFTDYEGDRGWVHKSLVKKIPTVITVKERCNVRSGPGTNHAVLFSVGSGIPFKIIGKKGNWIHIEHADGDRGWIHKSLVW